ncbi:hypothetical protein [Psychromonas ingrahamii]|nr:hypothetical protein [Psychromonas ingrahamii]
MALPGLNADNSSVDDLFEALLPQRGLKRDGAVKGVVNGEYKIQ